MRFHMRSEPSACARNPTPTRKRPVRERSLIQFPDREIQGAREADPDQVRRQQPRRGGVDADAVFDLGRLRERIESCDLETEPVILAKGDSV